jgi:SAM-dependent methyltransferase
MPRSIRVLLVCALAGWLLVACPPGQGQEPGAARPEQAKAQPGAAGESRVNSRRQAARRPDIFFVPTPQPVVEGMLELAGVKKGDVVYDLGCGDGRIVITAAKKYGARGVGIDIDPKRVDESRENVRKNKVGSLVTIREGDIFLEDFSDASVVTLYLLPDLNVKLMPKLAKLKPGTRIVSHDFTMKGARPRKTTRVNGHGIYLWVVPFDKER